MRNMPTESEYSRVFKSPQELIASSADSQPMAGLRSKEVHATQEPALQRKKKVPDRVKKVTFNADSEGTPVADEKSLRFRAGMRRLPQLSEYQYHFTLPVPSNHGSSDTDVPTPPKAVGSNTEDEGHIPSSDTRCRDHHDDEAVDSQQPEENIASMGQNSAIGHSRPGKTEGASQSNPVLSALTLRSNSAPKKPFLSKHKSKKHDHQKKRSRLVVPSALTTEYRSQFKAPSELCKESTGDHSSTQGAAPVLTDATDPRLLKHSPLPLSEEEARMVWSSEYNANFFVPSAVKYQRGEWLGAPHPDLYLPSPPKMSSDIPEEAAGLSWFEQVIELRQKAEEYKQRQHFNHLDMLYQVALGEGDNVKDESSSSSCSSCSSGSPAPPLARSDENIPPAGGGGLRESPAEEEEGGHHCGIQVEDIEESGTLEVREKDGEASSRQETSMAEKDGGESHPHLDSSQYPYPQSLPGERWVNHRATEQSAEPSDPKLFRPIFTKGEPNQEAASQECYEGRVPTPDLLAGNRRRHHLDRTTPFDGGILFPSPRKRCDAMQQSPPLQAEPLPQSNPVLQSSPPPPPPSSQPVSDAQSIITRDGDQGSMDSGKARRRPVPPAVTSPKPPSFPAAKHRLAPSAMAFSIPFPTTQPKTAATRRLKFATKPPKTTASTNTRQANMARRPHLPPATSFEGIDVATRKDAAHFESSDGGRRFPHYHVAGLKPGAASGGPLHTCTTCGAYLFSRTVPGSVLKPEVRPFSSSASTSCELCAKSKKLPEYTSSTTWTDHKLEDERLGENPSSTKLRAPGDERKTTADVRGGPGLTQKVLQAFTNEAGGQQRPLKRQTSELSLSELSLSSCSVASDVLARARERKEFWNLAAPLTTE